MSYDNEQFLFVEKYRPQKVSETILPDSIKSVFQGFVDQKQIPNLLLCGSAGTGKTTIARAMCEELEADYIVINASMNGGIDAIRNEIKSFASTVSFTGGRKVCILDEADYIPPLSQAALRNFMEEHSKNCGFILTCNFKNKIIDALHSRCSVVEFRIPASDKSKLAAQFMKRVAGILEKEGIEYDKQSVAAVIMKYFPDWRRVLNELQRYSVSGKIDSGILVSLDNGSFGVLVECIKAKKWKEMRKWVGENLDSDPSQVMRKFYDASFDLVAASSVPTLVLLIAEYQYKLAFSTDTEICLVAFLTQVMSEIEFV